MKKILYIIITGLLLFIGINYITALDTGSYNGNSGDNSGPGGKCGSGSSACMYYNDYFMLVKMTLVYYDGNTRTQIGTPAYITNSSYQALNNFLSGKNYYYIPNFNSGSKDYTNFSRTVEADVLANLDTYLAYLGVSDKTTLDKETKKAGPQCGVRCIGYRIIIEPVFSWRKNSSIIFMTPKEMASSDIGVMNSQYFKSKETGFKLDLDYSDIGISKVGSYDRTTVANSSLSPGYNIIDFFKGVSPKKCYKMVTVSNAAVCKNTGKNNIGDFYETPKEVKCDSGEADETIDKDGRIVKINGCEMSCVETAQQNFPGNIKHNVEVGTYLIWPTSSKTVSHPTFQNKYSMTYKGTISCKIKKNADKCNSLSNEQIYPFNVEASVSWHDGNKVKTAKVSKSKPKYKRSLSGDVLKLTATVVYSLSDHFNQYISKKDYAVSSNKPNASYVDIGYANLSLDRKAESGTYNLSIKTTNLGARTNFVSSSKNQDYTCKYKTVKFDSPYECPEGTMNPGADLYTAMLNEHITYAEAVDKYCNMDSCICPENSKMAGKNLVGYLSSMSCSDAQNKYCDYDGACLTCPSGTANEGMVLKCPNGDCNGAISTMCEKEIISEDDVCDDADGDSKYCPAPNDDINISACISAGMSYSECANKLCNGNKKYTCKNTNGVGGKMDITACVQTKVAQGLSVNEAIDACDMVICPLGKTIIYRVIDLANPFPSYDADKKVTQTGLRIGMFNDNLRGRYPGSNWNSETVVKKEILNNRNVDGDSVYTSKPMYVFELNSNTLKTIRKYNKNKKYDDFNLKCKNNNSTACVSSFVHNKAYGLTGGVYSGNLTKDNFYSYDNKATN